MNNKMLIISVIFASIVFSISTEIFVPAFTDFLTFFNTSESMIQRIISYNLLGTSLSCLFAGNISDSIGRRPLMLIGLFTFLFGSIICCLTININTILIARFIQGLGCGIIASVGISSILDTTRTSQSIKLISLLNSVITGVMTLSPIVGNYINIHYGPSFIFKFIALLSFFAFVLHYIFGYETLNVSKCLSLNKKQITSSYLRVLSNYNFNIKTLIWVIMSAVMIVFVTNMPFMYINNWNIIKSNFIYYQMSLIGTFFIASLTNAYFISFVKSEILRIVGTGMFCFAIIAQIILFVLDIINLNYITLSMVILCFGLGMSAPIYFVDSMAQLTSLRGTANSLAKTIQLLIIFALLECTTFINSGSYFSVLIVITCGLGFVCFLLLLDDRNRAINTNLPIEE